ncbi:MAG: GH116 family glycosyl hydrolase [Protaetiibacter sp.]
MTATLTSAACAAAFPLGGIGTGNVSIGARGELRDWELANRPAKGARNPFSFFAIRVASPGAAPLARILEAALRPPHEADQGYYAGELGGLPRFAESRMRGSYPWLELDLIDPELPVEVTLTAFTPFVPLDADDSGIPGAVLRYRVRNAGPEPLDVAIAGSLSNLVGAREKRNVFHFPDFDGHPRIERRDADGLHGILLSSELAADDHRSGTLALSTPDDTATIKPEWVVCFWQDGAQLFWDEFRATGRLTPEPKDSLDADGRPEWQRLRTGSVAISHTLAPGEERDFEFRLTWSFPNRPRGWDGNIVRIDPHLAETVRNAYAVRYPDAWSAAAELERRLPELEAATRAFTAALHDSTLPPAAIDAAASNLVVIRSTTCFRLEDGTFAAWEGSFDAAGSCEGSCTHVWNYAQSLAWLFPELERSARRVEFTLETRDDGRMNFRTNRIFGSPAWDFHPAVDGQLGAIVRVYREWRLSGDEDWLREVWPGVVRALDFASREWDSDGDGVLDGHQHNTYDIEFLGANSLAGSMYYAALHAAARLAEHLGEPDRAAVWRETARVGAERMDELLFNGEYYEQRLDDVDAARYQYGTGVLSDQVFGQSLAHLVGLGHVLPAAHAASAVRAVHRHNFRAELSHHESVQRTYALGDEAGLVLCSWPRGGRPRIPFVYSDEVWTGIEYQVATHLIFEGAVDEGLELVRAVRARHDGVRRNPWNEVECGNHYARSLASWGVLLALGGVHADVPGRTLSLAPATPGPFRSFFSTGTAWGRLELDDEELVLRVDGGLLDLGTVVIHGEPYPVPHGPVAPGGELAVTRSRHQKEPR